MELTRELYWNVGHGAATLVPMYLVTFIVIGVMVKSLLQRLPIYRQGKPLIRTDRLKERILRAAGSILLQKKITKKRWSGLLHGFFFWGFSVLTIGTILVFIQADFTDLLFGGKFLTGIFYLFFSLSLDIAGLVSLVMLVGLLLARFWFSAEKPEIKPADIAMYGILVALLVTGFVIEGARMAATELGTSLSYWSPVGLTFALPLSGLAEESLLRLHMTIWWLHFTLFAGFVALLPFTRVRHVVFTSLNYVFESLEPKGKLVKLDLENEEVETFGATTLSELTWKDIYDADACTTCMRCQENCPAYTTGKPLSPMKLIQQVGQAAETSAETNLAETFGEEELWACTTCGACQKICPAAVEHVGKVIDCRRAQVLMHATFPPELMETFTNLENQSNPWGFNEDTRADWCKGLDVPIMAEAGDVDILWFVGCAGSFEDRSIKTSKAIASILNKAGVKYAILGKEERCNGDMARRCGNEYLAQMMIAENVETINRYNPKRILTGCPHCYNTIKNEYPEFGASYDVVSHADFIAELIENGALKIQGSVAKKLTFHDSCYLGRWNNVVDSPRKVLSAINRGGELVEMAKNRENTMCCGAGGGRMFMEETKGERINNVRYRQVLDTEAEAVATACPFCMTMLNDGMNALKAEAKVKDIAQLVDSVC